MRVPAPPVVPDQPTRRACHRGVPTVTDARASVALGLMPSIEREYAGSTRGVLLDRHHSRGARLFGTAARPSGEGWEGPATWPYSEDDFGRSDERDDAIKMKEFWSNQLEDSRLWVVRDYKEYAIWGPSKV